MAAAGSSNEALAAPERNRYFYGKLMDEVQFNKEQLYFNSKRWLLNRLVSGSGVVCGLGVAPESPGVATIAPGVAIDGWGREIVVPAPTIVNYLKLTDDSGNPTGETVTGNTAICLAYAESPVDPVPVLVADCDSPGNCACGTFREGFHILVRKWDGSPPTLPACNMGPVFLSGSENLYGILSGRSSAACEAAPTDPCVILATVARDGTTVDSSLARPLVFRNELLFKLLLCLADQLGKLTTRIRIVSGDGQRGDTRTKLGEALVVEVRDAADQPIAADVQFQVIGGGSVDPPRITADAKGRANTNWTLGPSEGTQIVVARTADSPFAVTFGATAT